MRAVCMIPVIVAAIVLTLIAVVATIVMITKIIRTGVHRKGKGEETEEARMIQEIYHGLSRMEERVEALETILLDRKQKDRRA